MSLLSQYIEKEALLKKLSEELNALESNDQLKRELAFKEQLEALMKEFDKSARDVIVLLDPKSGASEKPTQGQRKARKLKVYKNPNTGEVVETRGGNQKTLKQWKTEHGDETVEGWLVRVED